MNQNSLNNLNRKRERTGRCGNCKRLSSGCGGVCLVAPLGSHSIRKPSDTCNCKPRSRFKARHGVYKKRLCLSTSFRISEVRIIIDALETYATVNRSADTAFAKMVKLVAKHDRFKKERSNAKL
jgi:hypothetical protein